MKQIIPPELCPSCSSNLVYENFVLYCKNKQCESRGYKSVEHFCKALKIKGLGPETISKLDITSINDVLLMPEMLEEVAEIIGIKNAEKIIANIEASKSLSLNILISALGIPLVGISAANKLCEKITNLSDFTIDNVIASGLTPKVTEYLCEWLEENPIVYYSILDFYKGVKSDTVTESSKSKGCVCITGKLKTFKTKAEGYEYTKELGFLPIESFTLKVTHLINESAVETSTTEKARKHNITILTNIKDLDRTNI